MCLRVALDFVNPKATLFLFTTTYMDGVAREEEEKNLCTKEEREVA